MQTFTTSKSREKILSKIRNGLGKAKLSIPFPEVEKESVNSIYAHENLSAEEAFANAFINLGGKFVFCENEEDLLEGIHALYDSRGWKEILCTQNDLLVEFNNNKLNFIKPADPNNTTADACITDCEVLIGRTGSILISSKQHFGRIAPVFYPVHIVVAYRDQIVPDIQQGIDFIKKKYGNDLPSMINLNTGPSRTADIEKTLVVGVHGPGEVFCFFINS